MNKIAGPTQLLYLSNRYAHFGFDKYQYCIEPLRNFEYAIEVEQPDGSINIEIWQNYSDASRLDTMLISPETRHERVAVLQYARIVEDEKDMEQARRRRVQLQHVLEVQDS